MSLKSFVNWRISGRWMLTRYVFHSGIPRAGSMWRWTWGAVAPRQGRYGPARMSSFLSDNQGSDGGSKLQVFENAITRLKAKDSTVEIVYPSHNWPSSLVSLDYAGTSSVAVLDSSFNPPTSAHLALALAAVSESVPPSLAPNAILLLLSVRNADKQLKPGDASHVQRLQMMTLLAQEIERVLSAQRNDSGQITTLSREHAPQPSVAVAAIDEPTFVGKSSLLMDYFSRSLVEAASLPPAAVSSIDFHSRMGHHHPVLRSQVLRLPFRNVRGSPHILRKGTIYDIVCAKT
ncbi:hypothetical protein BS47DRAFT_452818 [Hydnum rufescens UP504]|uniref:Nicotinamide-nucleotide adenylyltransferase n=1 Tax=Hydnum rufescens UP504 TaxID=1448309 RepID=A0A9P6DPH0_9AGAM|nr:hypothetical protein BS47DRAFT_452818 [Hydnum rufescens UP504]